MLVAIEGIDGAGKGTLTKNLVRLAKADGVDAVSLSFPRYDETRFGKLIAQYLNGRFGRMDEVPVRFAALLYAGERHESRDHLLGLLARHELVVLDRYVASNMAYNGAKLPAGEREALLAWIDEIEFELFELPAPDLTCLIETSSETADRLVAEKASRAYTRRVRDLHESEPGYMERVTEVYRHLSESDRRSTWFRCQALDEDGRLRPPGEIAAEAWRRIRVSLTLGG